MMLPKEYVSKHRDFFAAFRLENIEMWPLQQVGFLFSMWYDIVDVC